MALVVVGDKIGIDAPTVGASSGIWGGEQNSSTFPELDELVYAPREDRNLVITGGGKMVWDSAANQLSFTESIVIYNHITANTVSITTAASPITLDTALKVGYVKINRKPSSNQSITSVTVAAAGALPNANSDADAGVFVLFFRTSESTLILPWIRRELLSGESYQLGNGTSQYQEIASRGIPKFKSNVSDTSQLLVVGTSTDPAVVQISGKLYANIANATMDMDTAGRNGLDTGTKAADTTYYLYAITPASGRTFDLVASLSATSPTGFTDYKQIGVFLTVSASAIDHVWGTAELIYHRMKATSRKPGFRSNSADTSQVIVPAGVNNPACVIIDGDLYINTTNATMDLDTAGRNGLDTGAKAATTAYYLYAIPPASGKGFDVVCSVTAPSGAGPTGFTSWSYLGAFVTLAASAINPFFSYDGFYSGDTLYENTANITSTSPTADTLSPCPTTIRMHYGRVSTYSGTTTNRLGTVTGANSSTGNGIQSRTVLTTSVEIYSYGFFPAINGATVYLFVSNADTTVRFHAYGWIESPTEWR